MPEYVYKQAFLEAYNANPLLVGEPRENDADMGVPNISQQCSENGILTWADVKDVGQLVYFTDWSTLERHVFSHGEWTQLGGGSDHYPELPPATLPGGMRLMIAPGDYPEGVVLVAPSNNPTVLVRKPNSPGVLLRPSIIGNVTIDGNGDQQNQGTGSEIELADGGLLVDVEVLRWRDIGVDAGGNGAKVYGLRLRGLGRSGFIPDGTPVPSAFGLHISQGAKGTFISGADIADCGLNGFIDNGQGTVLEDSDFENNHLCWTPAGGGGQVDFSGYSKGGTARRVVVGPSSGEQASGIEVDGQGQTLEAVETFGHKHNGIIIQSGKGHKIKSGISHDNAVGLSRQGDAQVTVTDFKAYDNTKDYDG